MASSSASIWDRLLTATGAGALVRSHPRMKWLLLEPLPFLLWVHLTGGFGQITPYFVSYLGLIGARERDLFWLLLVFHGGMAVQSLWVVTHGSRSRPRRDPKSFCLRCTWAGRATWFLVLLWPLLGWQLGLSSGWILGGVLLAVFLAQVLQMAGASAWVSWTREVVPEALRGRFFAWRMIAGFILAAVFMQVLRRLWPGGSGVTSGPLWWLMTIFAITALLGLLSTLILAIAPDMDADHRERSRILPPLRQQWRNRRSFWYYSAWNLIHVGSYVMITLYLKPYLSALGISDADYASYDAWIRSPCLILGEACAGWALPRMPSRHLATLFHCCLLGGYALLLSARHHPQAMVLAPAFALESFGLGMGVVVLIGHLYRLTPALDFRFPALFFGLGACGSLVAAAVLACLPRQLDGDFGLDMIWWLMAIAVIIRLLATPLVMASKAPDDVPPALPRSDPSIR